MFKNISKPPVSVCGYGHLKIKSLPANFSIMMSISDLSLIILCFFCQFLLHPNLDVNCLTRKECPTVKFIKTLLS